MTGDNPTGQLSDYLDGLIEDLSQLTVAQADELTDQRKSLLRLTRAVFEYVRRHTSQDEFRHRVRISGATKDAMADFLFRLKDAYPFAAL